jgi:hypothetical protein
MGKRDKMRKHGIILSVYSIIVALYIALSIILTTDRDTVFWIGFAMVLFAVGLAAVITVVTNRKRSSAFPLEISMVAFSAIYVAVVVAINILFGFIFNTAVNIFISIHLMCMALYAIITVLMFATKNLVIKQNNQANGKICEMQILIYEFEKIKTKLIDMQLESKKKALLLIDSLLDELRFSDFGLTVDVSDIDTRLRSMAEMLSAEVDNLVLIKSDDITSMEAIINDIKKVVKDRNMQIRLMSSKKPNVEIKFFLSFLIVITFTLLYFCTTLRAEFGSTGYRRITRGTSFY